MKYEVHNKVAVLTFNDSKVNAVGHEFIDELNEYLERAEKDSLGVVLCGTEGAFSAGFDLKEFAKGMDEIKGLASRGVSLIERLYSFPNPLLSACTGHAIGLGAFMLLASDNRIGAEADYTIALPETEINFCFSAGLLSLIRQRIDIKYQTIAAVQSYKFSPTAAVAAGFLDEIVSKELLLAHTITTADKLMSLPLRFYSRNKLDLRSEVLTAFSDAPEVSLEGVFNIHNTTA